MTEARKCRTVDGITARKLDSGKKGDFHRFVSEQVVMSDHSKESLEAFRDVGERALTAGGIHLAEGSALWNAYR